MGKSLKRMLVLMLLCGVSTSLLSAPKPKKTLYIPMDYSTCGYRASEEAIPDVRTVLYVAWRDGDCSPMLQSAIDQVAKMKPDNKGRRGCILLGEGQYRLKTALRITTSGIVIRGMGRQKTILLKEGEDRGAAIYIEGRRNEVFGDSIDVIDSKVLAGSTTLTLSAIGGLQVGDRVRITRPSTAEWIASLGMEDFGGGLDYTGWKPTDIDIEWDRTVVAVNGTRITLDAPITTTISKQYGGAVVQKGYNEGEINECGIENLGIDGWQAANAKALMNDEDHCWDGIFVENARDCWVRRVGFRHLAGSAVNIQRHVARMTVEDCLASEPISEIGGWRRCVFLTRGQQTLVQRCVSRHGIHDFAAGYCAAGPNAFVQCEGEEALGFSGSIGSWAAGLLFDIVNIDGHDLCFKNLEQFQFGTGWNTANSMFWQCTASAIWCYSPDADNRSSSHGCWGMLTGNGEWTSSNDHVQPRSLFYAQLQTRLDSMGVDKVHRPQPWLLPMSTEATTSPTVEKADEMAKKSLTERRLTLEHWIDSVADQSPLHVNNQGLKNFAYQPAKILKEAQAPTFGITNGHLTANGRLIIGNRYDIPWWSGRVKDNFCENGARPAITRFVPGREGTGWTDRIDSVICYMKRNHFVMLDHHYGLWYDLRRTDHERIRRADGDVWAPFYEQPFARQDGTAWDGLSRYDLTRPNAWYWSRLREYADKGAGDELMLFNQHYFQHNILEAGAHWVDCPWRPVNNVNHTESAFPEPVPFAGDKRIFMAEQFYDETNDALRALHKHYIRMCLEELKDQPNAVHLVSAEYTGPLHFTRFWLQTIAEWEAETGRHPLIALSCTKDVQDAILADASLSKIVDIIDIRYWHYNTDGLWAPLGGRNMAPRQWMRQMKVGKTGQQEAYRAVREYRDRYPDKAVTFFSQQYPDYGWAVLMAGGSLPNVRIDDNVLRHDVALMQPIASADGCWAIGNAAVGYLVYALSDKPSVQFNPGKYIFYRVDRKTGNVKKLSKPTRVSNEFSFDDCDVGDIIWMKRMSD